MAGTRRAETGERSKQVLNLANLPDLVLDGILKYLSYDHVAKMRILSRRFNNLCSHTLNRSWRMVNRAYAEKRRRDGASDPIRATIRNILLTRYLLKMRQTYRDFIDLGMCCFIPGKVLDAFLQALRSGKGPMELLFVTNRAAEHFSSRIAPELTRRVHGQGKLLGRERLWKELMRWSEKDEEEEEG